MKLVLRMILSTALILCGCALAAQAPSAEQIDAWAKQLADDDFSKRAAAEDSLREAGEAARPALEKTSESSDAEAKARARRLLKTLKTEPILKKMLSATLESRNIEADMEMKMKMMNTEAVMKGHFKGTGDGKKLKMDMAATIAGQPMPMRVVGDGTNFWSEITAGDKKIVQKFSQSTMEKMGGGSQNPLQGVKELRDRFIFTDVSDGKIDDMDVYVLEGRIREGVVDAQAKAAGEIGGPMAAQMTRAQLELMDRSKIYVDKKTFLVRKSEVLDVQGQVIISVDLTNIKVDAPLDENEFRYAPPSGVKVMDMDEQMKALRAGGAPGAPAGEGQ